MGGREEKLGWEGNWKKLGLVGCFCRMPGMTRFLGDLAMRLSPVKNYVTEETSWGRTAHLAQVPRRCVYSFISYLGPTISRTYGK
jgi:hypothetical protein